MKLIVRSQYWGTVLRGKPRVDAANPSRSFRTISSQAVLTIEGKYWGCCQGQGKRVLELTEQHFVDVYPGDWDLYLVGSAPTESEAIHTFFVLPQSQRSVDVQFHLCYSGWLYYGTVSATSIRRQLRELLSDVFKPNETIGFRYHHVHIEILMSQVTDHAAKAKKANNNGKQEKSNEGKDKTTPAAGETSKSPTPVPPAVAKSASNDASATTEITSSPSTTASYYEAAAQQHDHHVPQFVHSGSFDADMICYPVPMPHQYQLVNAMPAHPAPHAHVVASAAMYHPPPPHYHDHHHHRQQQQQQYHAHAAAPPQPYPVLNPVPVGCFVPLNTGFVPPPPSAAGWAAAAPNGGRVPPRAAADPVMAREDGAPPPPPAAAAAPHHQPPSQAEEEAPEDGPLPPPPQTH